MTNSLSFSNYFVKFHDKKSLETTTISHYIQISVIMRVCYEGTALYLQPLTQSRSVEYSSLQLTK